MGKRPMNTAGSTIKTANRMEVLIHQQVHLWFGVKNLLAVFGKLRQVEQEAPSSVSWILLANYKVVNWTGCVQSPVEEQCDGNSKDVEIWFSSVCPCFLYVCCMFWHGDMLACLCYDEHNALKTFEKYM